MEAEASFSKIVFAFTLYTSCLKNKQKLSFKFDVLQLQAYLVMLINFQMSLSRRVNLPQHRVQIV